MYFFGGLHPVDLCIVLGYFSFVLYLGKRAARRSHGEEGFFLANRSVGKLYQFFLNFGQSTDPQSAVSTASIVYQSGISGVWLMLQSLFMNPYYWFMNVWFRRARLTTVADLFEDRLGSRGLARTYSIFTIITSVAVVNGFANYVSYKIVASLTAKPEAAWTAEERRSVTEFREWRQLERLAAQEKVPPSADSRWRELQERAARGELRSEVTLLKPWIFYLCFNVVVGGYIILGGMHAMMRTEAIQGTLTVVFSTMLIPAGLNALGGWHAFAARVPASMTNLFGGAASQITGPAMLAILLVSVIQAPAQISNMNVSGSARDEFVARFGAVAGTYAKRIMIIMWAVTGLVAIALYQDGRGLADPDAVWGTLGRDLLGHGVMGLMLAGVLAGSMSAGSMQSMTVSAMFVRNVLRPFRPGLTERQAVQAGRWTVVGFLVASSLSASLMNSAFSIVQLFLLMNVPFGASILMIFLWRRLTAAAVWTAVVVSAVVTLLVPAVGSSVPFVARHPAVLAVSAGSGNAPAEPVFFERIVPVRTGTGPTLAEGRGRFHIELFLLRLAGYDVVQASSGTRFMLRFLISGMLPFIFLVLVSLVSQPASAEKVERFYGKMKTPVGATPGLDEQAMAETCRNPRRFDGTKLFPGSSWEFTTWNRTDAIGFAACCLLSGVIFAGFFALVHFIEISGA